MTREEFDAKIHVVTYLANDIVSKIKRRNEYYDIAYGRVEHEGPSPDISDTARTHIKEEIKMLRRLLLEVSKDMPYDY